MPSQNFGAETEINSKIAGEFAWSLTLCVCAWGDGKLPVDKYVCRKWGGTSMTQLVSSPFIGIEYHERWPFSRAGQLLRLLLYNKTKQNKLKWNIMNFVRQQFKNKRSRHRHLVRFCTCTIEYILIDYSSYSIVNLHALYVWMCIVRWSKVPKQFQSEKLSSNQNLLYLNRLVDYSFRRDVPQ